VSPAGRNQKNNSTSNCAHSTRNILPFIFPFPCRLPGKNLRGTTPTYNISRARVAPRPLPRDLPHRVCERVRTRARAERPISPALARVRGERYLPRMIATTSQTLEKRVAQLEQTVARLLAGSYPRPESWREVVGMFGDDEVMKQIDEEGARWREEENRRSMP
jgi:hypothetical protein